MASDAQQQCRLAITVFNEASGVHRTVHELRREGLGLSQLCVVALDARLDEVRRASAEGIDTHVLWQAVEEWPAASNGARIVATRGQVLVALLRAKTRAHGERGPVAITSEHTAELEAHVRRGAFGLAVLSSDPAQQRLSTRTLLGLSSYSVRTYEFSL